MIFPKIRRPYRQGEERLRRYERYCSNSVTAVAKAEARFVTIERPASDTAYSFKVTEILYLVQHRKEARQQMQSL